ncbi:MAG TPA: SRPBCC family protein [Mycobacterium sp.]|nr:SRPBCC family protein [Mycobacterium sp.]
MTKASTPSGNGQAGAPASGLLQDSFQRLAETVTERAVSAATNRLGGATERLTDYAQSGGGPGLLAAVTGIDKLASGDSPLKSALSSGLTGVKEKVKETVQGVTGSLGGKGGGNKKLKLTNIVEDIDVGVPVELAYRQWTEFGQFPKMMKKVEQADQESEEKLHWKAQVFWSHREWESTVIEQVPCDHIVWRSKGQKGHVDGAVSFHELGPNLTRILVVLEYHPQGLFERTGNLWRAQGRRVRLELKHFRRHAMTHTLLHPDDVEGWMGEIRDGEVVDEGETEKTAQPDGRKASSAGSRRRGEGRNGGGRRPSAQRTSRRHTATKATEEKEGSRT